MPRFLVLFLLLMITGAVSSHAQTDPLARPLVTPADLELVGGWRVPPATRNNLSMAFTKGGLTSRVVNGARRFIIPHHVYSLAVQEFTAAQSMGGPNVPSSSWPMLAPTNYWPGLYSPVATATKDPLLCVMGVHWDENTQRLWVSGRSQYAGTPWQGSFLTKVNVSDPTNAIVEEAVAVTNASMQTHGGGFCRIPTWFASTYLGGKTLGVGCGGYESGQDSSMGPTLTAVNPLQSGPLQGQLMMHYPWNGTRTQRERRPPDYQPGNITWQFPADSRAGYWGTERLQGGGAWIDTPTKQGLCFVSLQGVGLMNYALQNPTFTSRTAERFYVYHPSRLALSATGQLASHQVRGAYYEWTSPVPGRIGGMWFDSTSNLLYMLHLESYKDFVEFYPVVAVYRVKQ